DPLATLRLVGRLLRVVVLLRRFGRVRFFAGRRLGRRRRLVILVGAAVLGWIVRGHAPLGRAGVVGVGDPVAVGVDERAARALGIGFVAGRRDRAGVVDVGHAVAVLVPLGAAGPEGVGVRARRDGLALIVVVAHAVAVGVGDGDVPGAALDVGRGLRRLGRRRRAAEVVGERAADAPGEPVVAVASIGV